MDFLGTQVLMRARVNPHYYFQIPQLETFKMVFATARGGGGLVTTGLFEGPTRAARRRTTTPTKPRAQSGPNEVKEHIEMKRFSFRCSL